MKVYFFNNEFSFRLIFSEYSLLLFQISLSFSQHLDPKHSHLLLMFLLPDLRFILLAVLALIIYISIVFTISAYPETLNRFSIIHCLLTIVELLQHLETVLHLVHLDMVVLVPYYFIQVELEEGVIVVLHVDVVGQFLFFFQLADHLGGLQRFQLYTL